MRLVGAALVGLSLVAAACGGDDDGGGTASDATVDEGVRQGVDEALKTTSTDAGTGTTLPPARSVEEYEQRWADQRAAVVQKIKDNGWGLSADGQTITGPDGFTIDVSQCPAGWNNTEGVSDSEIKIGHTTALSGTLADYGNIAKAMNVFLEYDYNQGAFTDANGTNRRVNLIVKDDGYDAARTIPLVDELIDSERVFAVITLGSPNTMKTYDKLNQRCIPHPLAMTGHPAWGDPVNHPWTTGMQLAYNTEAVMWGAFIEQHIDELAPDGGTVTVAALVMNNDFGKSYDGGFRAWLDQSPIKDRVNYQTETIEPQTPTIKDPMTTLAAESPHVFIAMVAGTPCTQAITEAAENGMKEDVQYLFQPSVCAASSFVGKDKVGGDGSATDGWWIVNGGTKDPNSPAFDDDVIVQFYREQLTAKGIDYKSSGSLGSGYLFYWPLSQALQIAGQLDGGVTRANLIVALRSMDMTHPFLLDGIRFNMSGNRDAYFIEGGIYQTYDSAEQGWVDEGSPIELSGKSKPCAWDQGIGACT